MKPMVLTLSAISAVLCSCVATAPTHTAASVRVYNIYKTGSEAIPRQIDGCKSLGSVSAMAADYSPGGLLTTPAYDRQGLASFDPQPVLQTIRARAARKSADTVIVSFNPGVLEWKRRNLRARAFQCGTHPLPPTFGEPLP
jgi:hypothetical protein